MRINKNLVYLFGVYACLLSCTASRPAAYVIINNESSETIPIDLLIYNQHEGKQKERISHSVRPGLQHIPVKKFPKGSYSVEVKANAGVISKKYPLALDTDRWIMITYMNDDSTGIQKKYGYVDTTDLKKINGKYTGINLYVENRRPPNL